MKKTIISLMLALALVFSLVLVAAPTAEAAEPTHTGHDGWTDLANYDGTALAAGNYYFSANVDGLANTIKIDAAGEYTICLNGKTVDAKQARQILHINKADAVVNICDCAGNGKLCNGGSVARGGNIYLQAGTLNIYSGTITGGTATERGGNICSLNGNLNVYGGSITNGADPLSANIYFSNNGKLNGEKNLDQIDEAVKAEKLTIDGAVLMAQQSKDSEGNTYALLKLYSDMGSASSYATLNAQAALKAQFILDLNGHDLCADIKMGQLTSKSEKYLLYFMDSSDGEGSLTYTIEDQYIDVMNMGANAGNKVPGVDVVYYATQQGSSWVFTTSAVGPETNPGTGDSANLVVMGLGLVLGVAGMACLLPKKHNV